ncbi:hypothetical protein BJ165DRAFT_1121137 [Panaeolus papilionaceus]|nr:hypothetical protein BJ165DRAFT_1121137 [Panaeolus papilionaceus]
MSNSTSGRGTFGGPSSSDPILIPVPSFTATVSTPPISSSAASSALTRGFTTTFAPTSTVTDSASSAPADSFTQINPTEFPTPPTIANASDDAPFSLSNTAVVIISVSAAVIILFIGALVSFLLRRKQQQKRRNVHGSFVVIPGSERTEKFPVSRKSSAASSFSARPPPTEYPQSMEYHDAAHSPLLQEAWNSSHDSSSRNYQYVARDAGSQNIDPNRSRPDSEHVTTPPPTHTRPLSQSTITSFSSDNTIHALSSPILKPNHSPYRQSIPLPPLSIPSAPVSTALQNAPPAPPPPPRPPRRLPQPPPKRTHESYDSDESESLYSQASVYPETPTPRTAKSYTTHQTHQTQGSQTYLSTIQLPSAIDYRASNVYSDPNHPALASSVFSAHPQFMGIPGIQGPGRSSRQPDLEEGIRRPSDTLYAPIEPVIIQYDRERTGVSRGESLIIGKMLKTRARNRESNDTSTSTASTSMSRNSSLVSHIERKGSIRGVSSPLVSEEGAGGRQRAMRALSRQPSRLSPTAEGYYFEDSEPMPKPVHAHAHAAEWEQELGSPGPGLGVLSPTGAAEGGMFSPLSPPSADGSSRSLVPIKHFGH